VQGLNLFVFCGGGGNNTGLKQKRRDEDEGCCEKRERAKGRIKQKVGKEIIY
jgi:hypothetical protein